MNKAILKGRLGKDPELKNGVVMFSLATDDGYKNKEGDKVDNTNWHNVTAFGKVAEILQKYVKKGDELLVVGRVQYSEKDGKYYTNIILQEFEFVGSREAKESKPEPVPLGKETGPDLPF